MSTKSKKTKQKSINQLINTLLETNLYHPQLVENTNRELNTRIYHTYEKIKDITDQLAILAHAAVTQTVIVRTMSNKQFKKIQDELLRLKNNLRHTK